MNTSSEISDGKGVKHYQKADFLFIKDTGDNIGYPMHPDSITDWLDKFSEKNNFPHINPHALILSIILDTILKKLKAEPE